MHEGGEMGHIAQMVSCTVLGIIFALMSAWPSAAQSTSHEKDVDFWQPLWMQRELWGPGKIPPGMRARLLRHTTYMQYGVQKEYQGARSTVGSTSEVTAAGGELYAQHCASCHGKNGLGDGDVSASLVPSPALLAFMVQKPISVDEYLLWSISEGGKDFDTNMPAFRNVLSRDDIWKIVAYMRAGFPNK
jgi:mono/diheme cytochrome c family protein